MTETEWFQGHGVEPEPRLTVLPWIVWAAVFLTAIIAGLALQGCASAPAVKLPCPVAKIHALQYEGATWFLLDFDNLDALRLRMIGLEAGTCAAGEFFGVDADAEDRMLRP